MGRGVTFYNLYQRSGHCGKLPVGPWEDDFISWEGSHLEIGYPISVGLFGCEAAVQGGERRVNTVIRSGGGGVAVYRNMYCRYEQCRDVLANPSRSCSKESEKCSAGGETQHGTKPIEISSKRPTRTRAGNLAFQKYMKAHIHIHVHIHLRLHFIYIYIYIYIRDIHICRKV